MSHRDKILAQLLDELATYVLPPQAANYADDRAAQHAQRERAIQVQVLLQSTAITLRDPKSQSKYISPAQLMDCTLRQVREYAAKPLNYEPYKEQS